MWFTLNLLFTISIFFANTATNIPSRWDDVPLSNVVQSILERAAATLNILI